MLAPARSNAIASHTERPSTPDPFEIALAAARMEALATLQDLLHKPLASAAEARERRLAATAILKIPLARSSMPRIPEARPAGSAEPTPAPAPTPQSQTRALAQPLAKPKPAAPSPTAAPIQPRPARRDISRLVCAAGADSS